MNEQLKNPQISVIVFYLTEIQKQAEIWQKENMINLVIE